MCAVHLLAHPSHMQNQQRFSLHTLSLLNQFESATLSICLSIRHTSFLFMIPSLCEVCVFSLCRRKYFFSTFLPQSINMLQRLLGVSNLPVSVNVCVLVRRCNRSMNRPGCIPPLPYSSWDRLQQSRDSQKRVGEFGRGRMPIPSF